MRRWKFCSILALALALGALGCGSSATTVTLTIQPSPTASVVTNLTQPFSAFVTGSSNMTVTWTIVCATGVTATGACGTINAAGLYTAPATIPTVTTNGTTTPAPTATITATAAADTTKTASTTITIITGIGISITPGSATVGTGEHFTFLATVTNPGCNTISTPTCLNVTWSLDTTLTGIGTIDPNSGVYTAPSVVPSPSTVTITATSVTDTSVTSTATVTLVTAAPPTVTSVSPSTTALGSLFQDFYITGTNFISTNVVYVNGVPLSPLYVEDDSTSLIRGRLPDYLLASPPPSGVYQITVSQQTGAAQGCAPDPSQCNISLAGVRPGVVGPSPDSISQGSAGVLSFNVDGGFFGTSANPAVSATYNGKLRAIQLPASGATGSTRQMTIAIGGSTNASDFSTPGLYPIDVRSATNASEFAFTNLAVQPNYFTGSSSITTLAAQIPMGAGANSAPNDVGINPATGTAVVVNTGTNDVTLIDINPSDPGTPKVIKQSICTASTTAGVGPNCPSSGPASVSVDYVRNVALVVNATTQTIAVIDLNAQAVTYVTPALQDIPEGIGVNPVTGRALVAMQSKGYGVIMDETQNPPAFVGIVSISSGLNPRVAVEPYLNWAIATPGGNTGSVSIVDLNAQTTNLITAVSRSTNVVTVTVQPASSTQPTLAVQINESVYIQGISDPSFNGFYTVTGLGPSGNQFSYTQTAATLPDVASLTTSGSVNYSLPVATNSLSTGVQGVAINPETQQAVLVDPGSGGQVTFFSLIDQSSTSLSLQSNGTSEVIGPIGAAFNSLTNTAVTVNHLYNTLSVIDPTTPTRLNNSNLYSTRPGPIAVAVDPGSNIAVIANQSDNSATVVSLGPITPFSISETSPKIFVANSTLTQGPQPAAQTLTVLGKGLTCTSSTTNLTVRLDGTPLQTFCVGTGDRKLTAIAPPSLLSSAHRFALDVADASGNVTNSEDFLVEQNVDVSSASCSVAPQPSGVAIDPKQNIAAVSLFGCNSLALINLATGTGQTVAVGTNPVGVAVLPRLHLAVVANNGSSTASVVDELGASVLLSPATDSGSFGASADEDTGEVAIANQVANTVSVVNASTGGVNAISGGASPVATAFNYVNHQVGVANAGSNSVGFGDGAAGAFSTSFSVNLPTSMVYDPVPSDCNQTNTSAANNNTVGCFIVNSSESNNVEVIDPISSQITTFNIGINPTAIAYNWRTSTLVSTNTLSHTVTVADFLARKVRAVLPLPAALGISNSNRSLTGVLQFALDIQPFTNIAVIADTVNGRVLFIPIPH